MAISRARTSDRVSMGITGQGRVGSGVRLGGQFVIECFDEDGRLKWVQHCDNLVANVGLQHLLDVLATGATPVNPWFVGLTASSPSPAAGDTMGSHGGWTEDQNYDETYRQTYVETRSAQTLSNSASKAVFTMSGTTTIGGAFLTSDSTKGGGTGTLLCCAAASEGNRSVVDNDVLNVTYTFSAADDGS